MKTLTLNVQVDDFPQEEFVTLSKALDELLKKYKRRRVNLIVSDSQEPLIPEQK